MWRPGEPLTTDMAWRSEDDPLHPAVAWQCTHCHRFLPNTHGCDCLNQTGEDNAPQENTGD